MRVQFLIAHIRSDGSVLACVILCKLKSDCHGRLCYPTGMSLFVLVALWFRRIVYLLYQCSFSSR